MIELVTMIEHLENMSSKIETEKKGNSMKTKLNNMISELKSKEKKESISLKIDQYNL